MGVFQIIAKGLTLILVAISLVTTLMIGLGLVVGYILNHFFSSIDFGIATLCGTLAVGIAFLVFAQVIQAVHGADRSSVDMETEDDDDSTVLSEEQVDAVTQQLMEAMLLRVSMPDSRSKRTSGRSR